MIIVERMVVVITTPSASVETRRDVNTDVDVVEMVSEGLFG